MFMKKLFVGEVIRKRRMELGLKQYELCEGICEPVTMSRLETGKQTPSYNKLKTILQRLGLPDDQCYMLLSKNEMLISDLQTEITSCNVLKDPERGLPKIEELEKIVEPDDTLTRQFILRSKASLGKKENGQIVPYTLNEKLDILFEAIRLTAPNFDIDSIHEGLYSIDEVKVINQIATVYSNLKQHKKAIDIYYQLLRYIKKHFQNILQSGGLLPLVCYNYARELDLVKRYEDALEIAQLGWQACIQYGQYRNLPVIIALMAECYHFLNDDNKSIEYYRQAYYIHKAIGNEKNIEVIMSETKKYFGNDVSF